MPDPNPFPCGGPGQKPCPPTPATEPKKESGLLKEPPKGDDGPTNEQVEKYRKEQGAK